MLGEVVVQIASVHQVQDEAQLVGGVKCIRHAHDERAVDLEKKRGGNEDITPVSVIITIGSMDEVRQVRREKSN